MNKTIAFKILNSLIEETILPSFTVRICVLHLRLGRIKNQVDYRNHLSAPTPTHHPTTPAESQRLNQQMAQILQGAQPSASSRILVVQRSARAAISMVSGWDDQIVWHIYVVRVVFRCFWCERRFILLWGVYKWNGVVTNGSFELLWIYIYAKMFFVL